MFFKSVISIGDKATDTANTSIHIEGSGKFWLQFSENISLFFPSKFIGPLYSESQLRAFLLEQQSVTYDL